MGEGRKKWYFLPLPVEMVGSLDTIVKQTGRKYGVMDKAQLGRLLIGDFIQIYEENPDFVEARLKFRGEFKKPKGEQGKEGKERKQQHETDGDEKQQQTVKKITRKGNSNNNVISSLVLPYVL